MRTLNPIHAPWFKPGGWVHPVLLSIWWSAHLAGTLYFIHASMSGFGASADAHATPVKIISFLLARWGLALPEVAYSLIWFFPVLLALLLWLAALGYQRLLRWTNLVAVDELARSSQWWMLARFLGSGMVLLSLAQSGLAVLALKLPDSTPIPAFASWPLSISMLLVLVLSVPYFGLNADFIREVPGAKWYRPSWPGWRIALFTLTGAALVWLSGTALESAGFLWQVAFTTMRAPWPASGQAAIETGFYFLEILLMGWLLSLYLYRIDPKLASAELRRRRNFRFISAWLLLDLRAWVWAAWIVAPILCLQLLSIWVMPQLSAQPAGSLDWSARLLLSFEHPVRLAAAYGWIALSSLIVAGVLLNGRFLLQLDALENTAPKPEPSDRQATV